MGKASKGNFALLVNELFKRTTLSDSANELFKRTDLSSAYSKTVEALIQKFNLDSSDQRLMQARRAYFVVAMTKGASLATCPAGMDKWSIADLKKEAAVLPDKEAQGWNGITALSEEDRLSFAKAAEKRREITWTGLIPKGQTQVILPFEGQSAQSTADKIKSFMEEHNKKAARLLKKAIAEDARIKKENPDAPLTAGKSIAQRQIRFDPDDNAKIQTLDPIKQKWMPGPRFGKFLQDEYEWMLYELAQRGNDLNTKTPLTDNLPEFSDLLNHQKLTTVDSLFSAGKLRVFISSDPQKIGEMSTGQRWHSCMARDGCNFRYVNNDIEQGSLIAYVVHEDDTQARYPFMRQLIKPFRSEKNETILVPARIYGGEGSSLTSDALQLTVSSFIADYNSHKKGNFRMAAELYEDGQSVWVNLQDNWRDHTISQALQDYQSGAIKEWMTELNNNMRYIENDRKGRFGEDPHETDRKLKNKMLRLFKCTDAETGLPRMFYREQLRTHIGTGAHPRNIHKVAQNDPVLNMRESAFQALRQGDVSRWMEDKKAWEPGIQNGLPYLAVITAKPGDGINTSLPMQKMMLSELEPQFDEYGSTGYSRESKAIFSFVMEKAMSSLEKLGSDDLLALTKSATNFLGETTKAARKIITINSGSWFDGSYDVRYNFERIPEEDKVAAYWCQLMQRLQRENPEAAADYARKIQEQYKDELSHTDQHKLAAKILAQSASKVRPTPAFQA